MPTITWTAPATGGSPITGYVLQRRTGTGAWATIATPAAAATTYTDSAVAAATQYGYQLAAVNSVGQGGYSAEGTVTTPAAASATAITNGTFESGVSGWTGVGAGLTAVTTPTHGGSGAARITCTTAGDIAIQQNVAVTAGTSYTASAWFRAASTVHPAYIQANWLAADGSYLSGSYLGYVNDSATGWTNVSGNLTPPTGCTQMTLICGIQTAALNEVHYIDDVTLV